MLLIKKKKFIVACNKQEIARIGNYPFIFFNFNIINFQINFKYISNIFQINFK